MATRVHSPNALAQLDDLFELRKHLEFQLSELKVGLNLIPNGEGKEFVEHAINKLDNAVKRSKRNCK